MGESQEEMAQLDHLLLDVDFFSKPKICSLKRRFGPLAQFWLIKIYCQMSRATNALIDEDVLFYEAEELGINEARELIEYSLSSGLIAKEGDLYTNSRVAKDQKALATKRKNKKEINERYRAGISKQTHDNHEDILETSQNNLRDVSPDTDTVTVTDTDLGSRKGGVGGKPKTELPKESKPSQKPQEIPFELDSLSRETLLISFRNAGLEDPDIVEQAVIVARTQYPHPTIKDLHKPWIKQELLKQKTQKLNAEAAKVRLERAKNPPNNSPPSIASELFAEANRLRELEKMKA